MKLSALIVTLILILCECDPPRDIGGTYHFNVKGTINNTSEKINLGDTIKFEVVLPSSITASNLDGQTRTETVSSLQIAFFGYHIFRIDTINHTVYTYVGDSTKVNYFLNPGYEINHCQPCYGGYANLERTSKPYKSILHLIPRVKGIFYLEIELQEGNFKINNGFQGLFSVSIDVPDKHIGLVDNYIPGFAAAILQSGMQVYCFEVK